MRAYATTSGCFMAFLRAALEEAMRGIFDRADDAA